MKLLTFVFLFFSSLAMCQTSVGVYLGYSDAHQKYEDWVDIPSDGDRTIDGFNAGLMALKPISSKLNLETRLGSHFQC